MILNIEIKPDFNGSIQIIDISDEQYQKTYLDDEAIITPGLLYSSIDGDPSFLYEDTCTLDVLKRIKSTEIKEVARIFTPHLTNDFEGDKYVHELKDFNGHGVGEAYAAMTEEDEEALSIGHYHFSDSVRFLLPEDGYYSIDHVVLPTTQWLEKVKGSLDNITLLDLQTKFSGGLYITDGYELYKVMLDADLNYYPVDIEEVLEINPKNTSISISTYKVFSIDNLKKCYTKIATNILCSGVRCGQIDPTLRFNRDFIWMTINVINFYLEVDQYTEAEIVLEDLGCYNFCDLRNVDVENRKLCGCHH